MTPFVTNLTSFLDVLLVILIAWSAINLTDYFLVRRGSNDVASFFAAAVAYLLLAALIPGITGHGRQITAAADNADRPA